ncbi:MAG: ferritin [Deltaproteobacteria bacterium]|nr:ferritin [Deltaproteobacteria bacterium]
MISKKMEKALNGQVNKEMYSAYLYMAMSSYSNLIGLKGFANWFMVQYHEEMLHAMKIYEYIGRQGGQAVLMDIKQPPSEWASPLDMFEKTLAHEKFITKSINDLMDLAIAQKDHATQIFLQWYVTEQIEEEENDNEIIGKLKLLGAGSGGKNGLFMIDKELGARITTVPTDYSKGIESAMKGTAA